jgi:hypothetical protein
MSDSEGAIRQCVAAIIEVRNWKVKSSKGVAGSPPSRDALDEMEGWLTRHLDTFCAKSKLLKRGFDPMQDRVPQVRRPEMEPVLLPLVALADEVAGAHGGRDWESRIQDKYLGIADAGDQVFDRFTALLDARKKREKMSDAGRLGLHASAMVLILGFQGRFRTLQNARFDRDWLVPSREILGEYEIDEAMVDIGGRVPPSRGPLNVLKRGPVWMGPALLCFMGVLVTVMWLYLSVLRASADETLPGLSPPSANVTPGARP